MDEKTPGVPEQPDLPEKNPQSPVNEALDASAASDTPASDGVESTTETESTADTKSETETESPAKPIEPPAPPTPAQPATPPQPQQPFGQQPQQPFGQQPQQPYVGQPAQPQQPFGQQPQQPQQPPQPQQPWGQPAQPYGQQPPQPMGYNGQGAYPPPPVPPAYAQKNSGKAVGALVCGILAILLSFLPLLGLVFGIVAIVLASKAVKEAGKNGKTTAGKVCGIIGIVFAVLSFIFWGVASCAIIAINELDVDGNSYNSAFEELGSSTEGTLSAEEEAAQAVAVAELDKLAGQDEEMVQLLATELDEGFVEAMGMSHTDLGVDPADLARWMLADFSYTPDGTYVDSTGNETTATMFADIELRDSYMFMTNFYDKVTEFEQSEEVKTMTQDEAKARIGELYRETMDETTDMTTWYTAIELEKQGDQWVIDQDAWEDELDAMFGIY